jgi:hypothetical protein
MSGKSSKGPAPPGYGPKEGIFCTGCGIFVEGDHQKECPCGLCVQSAVGAYTRPFSTPASVGGLFPFHRGFLNEVGGRLRVSSRGSRRRAKSSFRSGAGGVVSPVPELSNGRRKEDEELLGSRPGPARLGLARPGSFRLSSAGPRPVPREALGARAQENVWRFSSPSPRLPAGPSGTGRRQTRGLGCSGRATEHEHER